MRVVDAVWCMVPRDLCVPSDTCHRNQSPPYDVQSRACRACVVRPPGFEPGRLSALHPKCSASANSATGACVTAPCHYATAASRDAGIPRARQALRDRARTITGMPACLATTCCTNGAVYGGLGGIRTRDLCLAKAAPSRLSYKPNAAAWDAIPMRHVPHDRRDEAAWCHGRVRSTKPTRHSRVSALVHPFPTSLMQG